MREDGPSRAQTRGNKADQKGATTKTWLELLLQRQIQELPRIFTILRADPILPVLFIMLRMTFLVACWCKAALAECACTPLIFAIHPLMRIFSTHRSKTNHTHCLKGLLQRHPCDLMQHFSASHDRSFFM